MRYRGSVTLTLPVVADLEPVHEFDMGLVVGPVRDRLRPAPQGEPAMATTLQLTDIQEAVLSISPKDEEGNAAPLEGVPTWASSDETVLTVTAAADGMSATAVTVGPLGSATVTVSAQGDLTGQGSDSLSDTVTVEVVASEASSLNTSAGTPTNRPGV